MFGADAVNKVSSLSLSDNTVHRRIEEMSEDIKNQVVEPIKQSPIYVLQLDESTDVSSSAQLMVYVRYIHNCDHKEELLFCRPLDSQRRGIDFFNKVDTFLHVEILIGVKLALYAQMELLLCCEVILVSRCSRNRVFLTSGFLVYRFLVAKSV